MKRNYLILLFLIIALFFSSASITEQFTGADGVPPPHISNVRPYKVIQLQEH